ncbi:hypothetical protein M0813_06068 [Anaeramoeba flamelloides]|uniref:Spindle pole body component n=1 Tax=Anaeramoeba flamelloides TaxID=1746091 RepID=A0ABQ8XFQ3_9EUKA|nr:hypothetical protein M0813_06068 [Anaeramoeba flamelloides]
MLNKLKTKNESPWTNTDEEVFQKKRPNMFSGKPNLKDQIPEKELLRDLLYVLQGIEGKHIKYNLETDSYLVPFKYGVSLQKRNLISKISELGWLHQHIITFLDKSDRVGNSVGLVTSAFCSSIRNEMKNYYQFITQLISKIPPNKPLNKKNQNNKNKNKNKNKRQKFFQGKLTLFKLFSQTQSPLRKFRVLASICDTAETVKGGALISVLYDCLSHGDNEIRQTIGKILSKSWQPIFRIAKKWIRIGELDDPFKEFFVVSDPNVPKEHLWQKKYQLKKEMIPKFIEMKLANKILRIGKSINFIQECCRVQEEENNSVSILLQKLATNEGKENIHEVENFISNGSLINPIMSDDDDDDDDDDENYDNNENESSENDFQNSDSDSDSMEKEKEKEKEKENSDSNENENKSEEESDSEESAYDDFGFKEEESMKLFQEKKILQKLVEELSKKLDKEVLYIINNKYHFVDHCLTIKNFLLLGKGDFISHLMASLGESLSLPGSQIFRHNILGILENSIKQSSARDESESFLKRLDVKLSQPLKGQTGWDIFTLGYKVSSPINTILTSKLMSNYMKVFKFLWKLKRVEYSLSETWRWHMVSSSLLTQFKEIYPQLHLSYIMRNEMIHFVYNFQHYVMFEVLECSWADFVKELKDSKNLDDVIYAHNQYLLAILDKLMLLENSKSLLSQLFNIFNLVVKFKNVQDEIYRTALQEIGKQGRDRNLFHHYSLTNKKALKNRFSNQNQNQSQSQTQNQNQNQKNIKRNQRNNLRPQTPKTEKLVKKLKNRLLKIVYDYKMSFEAFQDLLSQQESTNPMLKFLEFRLDFNKFYINRMKREEKTVKVRNSIHSVGQRQSTPFGRNTVFTPTRGVTEENIIQMRKDLDKTRKKLFDFN